MTVFESLDKPGLTGTPTVLEGVTVDIPLRLVGRGYYKQVASLATGACLSFVEARADCCWYGASAPAGAASVCYHRSRLANLWEVASVGRIAEAARFAWRVARGGTAANATLEAHETWGEYLVRQGYGEQPFDGLEGKRAGAGGAGAGEAGAGGAGAGEAGTGGAGTGERSSAARGSVALWALRGQLGWLLTCTYEQILACPAPIILKFTRALNLGAASMLEPSIDIVRTSPSVDALQLGMAYGSTVVLGKPIELGAGIGAGTGAGMGPSIDGVVYDMVIVATEASAVRKIVAPCAAAAAKAAAALPADAVDLATLVPPSALGVFDEVELHPSRIVLHRDASLMPPKREQWKALNVWQPGGEEMSQVLS